MMDLLQPQVRLKPGENYRDIGPVSETFMKDPMQAGRVEREYERDLFALIEEYEKEVLLALGVGMVHADTPVELWSFSKSVEDIAKEVVLKPGEETVSRIAWKSMNQGNAFAEKTSRRLGVKIAMGPGMLDSKVFNNLHQRNLSALKGVTDEMGKAIIREVSDGMTRGEGINQIAKRIHTQVEGIGKARAKAIASYETRYAMGNAAWEKWEEFGIKHFKWLASLIEQKMCNVCKERHGKIYKREECPIFPAHPYCQCALVPVLVREGTEPPKIAPSEELQQAIKLDEQKYLEYLKDAVKGAKYADDQMGKFKEQYLVQCEHDLYNTKALKDYTQDGYEPLNRNLRNAKGEIPDQWRTHVDVINRLIDRKEPVPSGLELYRGIGDRTGQKLVNMKPGDICQDFGFQSFSLSPRVANSFTGIWVDDRTGISHRAVLRAVTKGVEKGIYIDVRGESEVIMKNGMKWKIIGRQEVPWRTWADTPEVIHIITIMAV